MSSRLVATLGPYSLRLADDSLGLSNDLKRAERPEAGYHSLSWVALKGLVFGFEVNRGLGRPELVARRRAATLDQFRPGQLREGVEPLGPGLNMLLVQMRDLREMFPDRNDVEAEAGIVIANGDLLHYHLVLKGEHLAQADAWRRFFRMLVYAAVIEAGQALSSKRAR